MVERGSPDGARGPRARLRDGAIAVALVALVLGVYSDVGTFGFVNFDDGSYVYDNARVRGGLTLDGVAWAFTHFHSSNWHPLTWLSHMLDVELYGLSPGGHHWTSVLIHAANALLLFVFLRMATGAAWRSALVAAFFAAHPLHVESVAWVSERKDVLSTCFWFGALVAWTRYARAPSIRRYAVVAMLFVLGLLSKPMVVTLPITLLVVDVWPLRRWVPGRDRLASAWPLLREKVPLAALSVASAIVTVVAQSRGGAVSPLEVLPLAARVGNAVLSTAVYLGQMVWPAGLSAYYPHASLKPGGLSPLAVAASALAIAVITALAVRQAPRRPWIAAGWGWYLVTLLPVIGIVQVGTQAHADRYTYVPLVGAFFAIAWSVPAVPARRPLRVAVAAALAVATATTAAAARAQTRYWRDTVALFERALAVDPENAVALVNLGMARLDGGEVEAAIAHFDAALRVNPAHALAHSNLAVAHLRAGDLAAALPHAVTATQLAPELPAARNALGLALERGGRFGEALREYEAAVARSPWNARFRNNLGSALFKNGRRADAIRELETAVELEPRLAEAHHNLGIAYGTAGRFADASRHMALAAELRRASAPVQRTP